MKALKIFILFSIALIFSGTVCAQKIKLVSGNLNFLKGQKVIKVEYDYEDMSVGKFDNEEDYIAKRVKEYNEAEPGTGDKWREAWFNDRADRFQPKFEELINKYLENSDVIVSSQSKDAKYTLILKTTLTEPGYNVGISRRPALINADVIFIETNNPDKELAKFEITKSPGSGAWGQDYDTGYRIQEAYAKCGKELGKYLSRKVF
jgi:hypothetical protein